MVQPAAGDAGADGPVGRDGGGAGSVGEDAVVDVPHGPQLGLQQHPFARRQCIPQIAAGVADVGLKGRRLFLAPGQQGGVGHGFLVVAAPQFQVFGLQHGFQPGADRLGVQPQQIPQPEGLFAVLVAVGVGDAPAGGAEGGALAGQTVLFQLVLDPVPGHRDGGPGREFQVVGGDVHPPLPDVLDFPGQVVQIHHHPVPQDAGDAGVEDPRGQQVEHKGPLIGDHRVAGVVASLVAHHDVGLLGQQVNDPALALVAPVEAGNCGQHDASSLFFWSTTAWTRVGRPYSLMKPVASDCW